MPLLIKSFLLSFILHLATIYLCPKFKICLDTSLKPQRVHKKSIPRAGGFPIFLSFLVLAFLKSPFLGPKLIFCSLPIFIGGFLEDITQKLSYKHRFAFMFLATLFFVYFFKNFIVTDLGFINLTYPLGIVFTIFALIGITNAFNLIDGINGLTSGLTLQIFLTLWLLSMENSLDTYLPLLEILIGSTLVFFIFNFFFNKIFLGDSGSYLLGFLSGVLTIFVVKSSSASPWVPMVLMFYPIWETLFSIFRRLKDGKNPFLPDREHFHHLLYEFFESSHFKTTTVLLLVQGLISLVVIKFYKNTAILISTFVSLIMLYFLTYKILKKKVKNN
ncbi:MAG TPA: undecaprenyl/decaprenyl-phosphate alpha-N-acetylglucosaminyl 1-phosphate transferase [Aquifex aeolicus]|nr:undecaprenyl/decaprenyl-phosphate alpha-N-acetylglucosaminyl 1-phosphate transferase [Aquificales bacterium]HIP86434.1 undecaprenyl/decaprenyl-phosphate alpha-N-acetylglucosaminyl 1-phosphate transferase [Aquifex sp.]HIQ26499.1 undecaprenyl/decaprenyl-phosphate alpha-N-acetylglucosaminyl 1-phosphate transferase [Aquifex aeolicus]